MPTINPSINISIGSYGEKYITSFHKYFSENEQKLKDYASFYKYGNTSDTIYFNALENELETCKLKIDDNANRKDLLEKLKEEDITFFLKNSVFNAYTDLVNLINQLSFNINFNIVNINIITTSFEDNIAILLNQLLVQIDELCKSGTIKSISVKLFIVISKDKGLLNTNEQLLTYQNLEEIRSIQSNYNSILHNVVFIDNLNTDAIFLNINNESIGFVLNEFITYLMTNQYNMIGNLFEANFISLGLGTLIFDKKFFHLFFKSRIIDKLVKAEQISDDIEHKFDTAGYSSLRDDIFYPFFNDAKEVDSVLSELERKVFPTQNNYTLLEYQFLLSNLLGKHDDIPVKKPLSNAEKISLDEVVFKVISGEKSIAKAKDINIPKYKHRLDEEINLNVKVGELRKNEKEKNQLKIGRLEEKLKTKHTELDKVLDEESTRESLEKEIAEIIETIDLLKQNVEDNNFNNEELRILEDRLFKVVELNIEEGYIIKETVSLFEQGKIKSGIYNAKEDVNECIIDLKNKKSELEKERDKSCFNKFFKPDLMRKIIKLESEISNSYSQLKNVDSSFSNAETNSKPFFDFKKRIEDLYDFLNSSVENIKTLGEKLDSEFEKTNLLNYRFIKHVIDVDILESYFEQSSDSLLINFSSLLYEIQKINSEDIHSTHKKEKFTNHLNSILTDCIVGIIDFNIVNYMNGNYDNLNLLKKESVASIIDDLLKTAKPFFNSDNSFDTNNSHRLMLHNKDVDNIVEVDNLHKSMKTCFTATIPQHINTINVNKFSIIKIDVIKDFTNIVKYNESKKVYEEKKSDTIIIK